MYDDDSPTLSQLEGLFPPAPYNFDQPPPQYLIGPIKTVLKAIALRLQQVTTDYQSYLAQVSVQTATGVYLDAHGVIYSTPRLPGEPDSAYRPRMLEALTAGRLTLAAISRTVANYYASTTDTTGGGLTPVTYVYDLWSDPTSCAADEEAGQPIVPGNVVIQIASTFAKTKFFFLDYSYLDFSTYLMNYGTFYNSGTSGDPGLDSELAEVRAGGVVPIFKRIISIA